MSTLEADVIATCEKLEFYGLKIANEKKKNVAKQGTFVMTIMNE